VTLLGNEDGANRKPAPQDFGLPITVGRVTAEHGTCAPKSLSSASSV